MVFGNPVTGVTQALGKTGQIDGIVQSVCGSGTGRDWGLVNDREF